MFHLDNNSGVSAMPAPAATQNKTTRWFTEGSGNQSPSWPGQDWFNIVQAELLAVLTAAGITPDKTKVNQLALAIKAIVGADALLQENNLSDLESVATAKKNLGLDKVGNYAAVPTAGGDVGYLDNSAYYYIKAGTWAGAGSFASQYSNSASPFLVPYGYVAPQDVSSYAPIIKGVVQTKTYGYGTAVSFGALTAGDATFAQACIHAIGDNETSVNWLFNPNTSAFSCPGDVDAGGNVNCNGIYNNFVNTGRMFVNSQPNPGAGQGTHLGWNETGSQGESDFINNRGGGSGGFNFRIVNADNTVESGKVAISGTGDITTTGNLNTSSGGVYEQGQRVYSPNNPPPAQDLSGYIHGDACNQAGFVSQNADAPYMMYGGSNIVELARLSWVNQNFVTAVRLGSERVQASTNDSGGVVSLGGGELFTGAQGVGGSDFNKAQWRVRQLQYCINGQWIAAGSIT